MSRLITRDIFKKSEVEEVIVSCEKCDEELQDGDLVFKFDEVYFCSVDCVIDWVGVESVVNDRKSI